MCGKHRCTCGSLVPEHRKGGSCRARQQQRERLGEERAQKHLARCTPVREGKPALWLWAKWRVKTLGMYRKSQMLYSVNTSPITGGRGAPSSITANKTGETRPCQTLLSFGNLWLQQGCVLLQNEGGRRVNGKKPEKLQPHAALFDDGGAIGQRAMSPLSEASGCSHHIFLSSQMEIQMSRPFLFVLICFCLCSADCQRTANTGITLPPTPTCIQTG